MTRIGCARLHLCRVGCVASLLCGFSLLVPCPAVADDDEIVIMPGITYGKGDETDLKLDLARPEEIERRIPAIVFVHGGGWTTGSRAAQLQDIKLAALRGYVGVTVSYRLTEPDANGVPRNPFPAQLHDVKCAVRWLRANADRFGIDANRIGAAGGSAGGHLCLLLGVTDTSDGLEGNGGDAHQSSRVQAVVNYFGPTDLAEAYKKSTDGRRYFEMLVSGKPDAVPERYKSASPITYLSKDDPPTLTLHGGDDTLIPVEQARAFDAKAREVGAPHKLVVYSGQGHGFSGETVNVAYRTMFEFFDEHLQPRRRARD